MEAQFVFVQKCYTRDLTVIFLSLSFSLSSSHSHSLWYSSTNVPEKRSLCIMNSVVKHDENKITASTHRVLSSVCYPLPFTLYILSHSYSLSHSLSVSLPLASFSLISFPSVNPYLSPFPRPTRNWNKIWRACSVLREERFPADGSSKRMESTFSQYLLLF